MSQERAPCTRRAALSCTLLSLYQARPSGERAGRGARGAAPHSFPLGHLRPDLLELHVARRHRPLQLRHLVERRARSLTLSGQPTTGGARGGVPVEPLRLWMGKVPPYPGEVKRLKDEEE